MNSTTYCEGAEHAVSLVANQGGTLVAVEGLAMMFSFVGVGVVSASTAAACWMMSLSPRVQATCSACTGLL